MRHGSVGHIINPAGYNSNYGVMSISGAVGVDLPTPTAYYPFNGNGNDVCTSPSNFGSYSGTTGLIGNGWNLTSSGGGATNSVNSKFSLSTSFMFSV